MTDYQYTNFTVTPDMTPSHFTCDEHGNFNGIVHNKTVNDEIEEMEQGGWELVSSSFDSCWHVMMRKQRQKQKLRGYKQESIT